jgi:DNA-binding NtrC family response regulator
MGLATSYSIIKRHGGTITFTSIVNKGTTFYIYLPISRGVHIDSHRNSSTIQELFGNILVIEDDLVIHDVLKRLLHKLGLESVFAMDGKSALDVFQRSMSETNRFNVVLIDLTLQGTMNGIEVVKKIHEIDPQIKCIITSGYTNDPVMINYAKYGFSGAISKPYTISQFYEVMQKALKP